MRLILFWGCWTFFSVGAWAQNKDIEWLREVHVERNANLDPSFRFITNSAIVVEIGAPVSALAIGILKKDSTLTRKGLYIVGSFCISSALTLGLKYTVNRERPFVTYPEIQKLSNAGSKSFPSGHTSAAFSTATSLSIAFPKWYVIAPSFLWASGVGYSRMHLGVHYPSDVLAGAAIGAGSAILSHYLNKKIKWERKRGWFL